MAEPLNIRLVGTDWEPRSKTWATATPALRARYWDRLGEIAVYHKRVEISEGRGVDGKRFTPVKKSSRPDGATGAPLDPHYAQSRTYRLLAHKVNAQGVTLFWRGHGRVSWSTIMGYHAYQHGPRSLPVRNTIGISDRGQKRIKVQAQTFWDTIAPAPKTPPVKPAPKPKPTGGKVIYTDRKGFNPLSKKIQVVTSGGKKPPKPKTPLKPKPKPKAPTPAPAPPKPPEPPKPKMPMELAREKQRAANATAAASNPHYSLALKDHPDLIPPGPIADRIAAYHVGGEKVKQLVELGERFEKEKQDLTDRIDQLYNELGAARRLRERIERRRPKQAHAAALAQAKADEDRLNAELDATRQLRLTHTQRRADAVADLLKADRPIAFGNKDVPAGHTNYRGEPLLPLTGDLKQNADKARAWLGKITEAGDVDRIDTHWGTAGPGARAHYDESRDHIQLGDHSPVNTSVHEMGHLLEEKLKTAGTRAVERGKEFLHHRVGSETPVDLNAKFGAGDPGEMGRKDQFDSVFSEYGAYYAGKQYRDATEILSMGAEVLYNDPLQLVKNDPEYAKYILGILDGSLR